jgi:hypothetical protein
MSVNECLIVSVVDIMVSAEEKKLNKKNIFTRVMLGDTCIDNLNLGSPNANMQD